MKNFKVLRVVSSMNPSLGGPSQGIRNSIPELKKLGVENEVVALNNPDEPFLTKDDFVIHALGEHKGPWWYNANLLPWLKQNLCNYDAVIVHGLWLYHGYAVNKALKFLKKNNIGPVPRVFVMPHGMLDPYFQKAAGRKLKAIRNWLYWKFIEGDLINNVAGVLFTTQDELSLAKQSFTPYKPQKEINVGYGIVSPPAYSLLMKEAFSEKCSQINKNEPFLLFLSRIHEKKGVDLLIDAYASILSDENAVLPNLVIAGPGLDTSYGLQMQEIVNNNSKLKKLIHFPGMLSGEAKWGAFYTCDAFILPSHQENFGISVAEALACSKPVLISNQINIWREIESAGGGIVLEDTLNGTINLLKQWQNLNNSDRKAMADNAKKAFELYFSIAPHAINVKNALA
ncbi:Glycosyltransferase involved in cell wall bisynthesis [Mucilaginibacter pineti]|uniref:Glycosyltransferase involved in cell wall bisynthesis n=1 Tax=Mucilaginibacter pineti TaxID=1391627 RepID=A0A1G6WBK8_9SPHI|nr:glycosyltransferase [Mucilaginibacter pineti]SDD62436.1 Glycosyltransferase involved in cell wall bisynthesis [Mucilaginibacter pineti]